MATWSFTAWHDEIPELDHRVEGLARLVWQYGSAVQNPRMRDFLDALLQGDATIAGTTGPTGVQGAEELAYQLLALRSVYTATGVNLDVLGRYVVLERSEDMASDAIYRLLLLIKILVNRSNGRLEELLDIVERVGVTEPIAAFEYWPAAVLTEATDFPADPAAAAFWLVARGAKGGGVRWTFVFSTYPRAECFMTSPDPAADQNSNSQGTEVIGVGTGGRIARSFT